MQAEKKRQESDTSYDQANSSDSNAAKSHSQSQCLRFHSSLQIRFCDQFSHDKVSCRFSMTIGYACFAKPFGGAERIKGEGHRHLPAAKDIRNPR